MKRFALALPATALALALLVPPAHALRVATYNMMGYENPGEGPGLPSPYISARQDNFRTIMAALNPDLLLTEEMNSAAAADSFRLNVLGNVAPGQWAGSWLSVGSGEGIGIFYKPALLAISNLSTLGDGGPRSALIALVKPAGYVKNPAWFRVYAVHLKAGDTTPDATTRNTEATNLRNSINGVPTTNVGPNFLVLGDTNIYDGTEGAYQRFTESQTNNVGRCADYLSLAAPWHQNPSNSAYYTQCPCNSCSTTGQSGGGLDDRFDLVLTSTSLQDGSGLDYVPGSYVPFGNDGLHYNTDINAFGYNTAVGLTIANALHDAADHIPAMITLQLPAKYAAPSQLAFGDAIVGATPVQTLNVANGAPAPATVLTYTLAASAGFTAPPGPFTANAGDPPNAHALGMDAGSSGLKSGTVTLNSNDGDTTSKSIALSGRVLDHAVPSLDSLAATTSLTFDFGAHQAGTFADSGVRVYDQGYGPLQARLSVGSANLTGDPRFSIAGGFTPATLGGLGATWSLHFDDAGAAQDSTYLATLTFGTADEPLPGAATLSPLTVSLRARVVGSNTAVGGAPLALRFLPPRPNPLRASTDLAFELPAPAAVDLAIFDLNGRRIASLATGLVGAGHHQLRWNTQDDAGRGVPAGLYFVRFATRGLTSVARLAVLP